MLRDHYMELVTLRICFPLVAMPCKFAYTDLMEMHTFVKHGQFSVTTKNVNYLPPSNCTNNLLSK